MGVYSTLQGYIFTDQHIYLSIYLYFHKSLYLSIYLSIFYKNSIYLSFYLSIYLSVPPVWVLPFELPVQVSLELLHLEQLERFVVLEQAAVQLQDVVRERALISSLARVHLNSGLLSMDAKV